MKAEREREMYDRETLSRYVGNSAHMPLLALFICVLHSYVVSLRRCSASSLPVTQPAAFVVGQLPAFLRICPMASALRAPIPLAISHPITSAPSRRALTVHDASMRS
jgi:hypothetical protein